VLIWRFWLAMNNKRGMIIGSFIGLLVLTIAVVFILVVFILGSGVVKSMSKVDAGVVVYNETGVEIDNIFDHDLRYFDLVKIRFLLEDERSVDEALLEVNYEG